MQHSKQILVSSHSIDNQNPMIKLMISLDKIIDIILEQQNLSQQNIEEDDINNMIQKWKRENIQPTHVFTEFQITRGNISWKQNFTVIFDDEHKYVDNQGTVYFCCDSHIQTSNIQNKKNEVLSDITFYIDVININYISGKGKMAQIKDMKISNADTDQNKIYLKYLDKIVVKGQKLYSVELDNNVHYSTEDEIDGIFEIQNDNKEHCKKNNLETDKNNNLGIDQNNNLGIDQNNNFEIDQNNNFEIDQNNNFEIDQNNNLEINKSENENTLSNNDDNDNNDNIFPIKKIMRQPDNMKLNKQSCIKYINESLNSRIDYKQLEQKFKKQNENIEEVYEEKDDNNADVELSNFFSDKLQTINNILDQNQNAINNLEEKTDNLLQLIKLQQDLIDSKPWKESNLFIRKFYSAKTHILNNKIFYYSLTSATVSAILSVVLYTYIR